MSIISFLIWNMGMQAQTWTGSTPAAGTFYLYNVGASQFLTSGTNWGSRASVSPTAAMPLTLTVSGTGYNISTAAIYDDRYLGSDGYMDNATPATWIFENVNDDIYKVSTDNNYLIWSGEGSATTYLGSYTGDARGQWRLVTKEALTADLVNATTDNPLNATFLISNSWFAKGNGCNAGSGIDACVPRGWTGTIVTDYWGNDGGTEDANYVVEQYGKTFNNYQALNVPNGEYVLSAQGFYRTGDTNSAIPCFYANNASEDFILIDDDGPATKPGNIGEAATALRTETGYYTVDGITAKVIDGQLTIGAKSESAKVDWCAFDNFSLFCTGIYFSAFAETLPNDETTTLTPGTWYCYQVPASGTYTLTGNLSSLSYTTNGAQKTGQVKAKSASSSLAINASKVYFMTQSEGSTLKLERTSETTAQTFTVCALNVDGLPQKILTYDVNASGPGSEGTELISAYLGQKGYDFIAVSEDFNYNGTLCKYLTDYTSGTWRGGLDASSLTQALTSGGKVDTDGLNFFWKTGHNAEGERWTSWNTTYGNLANGFDENIDKGFRYYKVTLQGGTVIDVYTLHMDAETADGDIAARETQLTQLANEIIANKTGRPKIVMGDTNCRYTRDQLKTLFVDAINNNSTLTVKDAWVENRRSGTYPTYYSDGNWQHDLTDPNQEGGTSGASYEVVDKIFFINPASGVKLQLQNFYLETDYVKEDGTEMGDHAPAVATFSVEGIQVLPQEANTFWAGETDNATGAARYLYNVGSGYYLKETGDMVQSIDNASVWNLWGDGNSRTISTENGYRLQLGYSIGNYYCRTATSSATTFTLSTGWSRSDSYKLAARPLTQTRYVNVKWNDNYSLDAGSSSDSDLSDWLFISAEQKQAYDDYVEAFEQANAYADYELPDELYNELVNALTTTVNYTNSTEVTNTLRQVVSDIKDHYNTFVGTDDCTDLIKNPSFEKKNATTLLGEEENGTNHNVYGWKVAGSSDIAEAFAAWEDASNTNGRYFSGMDGNHLFNTWTGGGEGDYFCRQDISVDEDGFYVLSAVVASGGEPEGDGAVDIVFGDIRNSSGTLTDRTEGATVSVCAYCTAGETYTIGLEAKKWFKADHFTLMKVMEKPDGDVNLDGHVDINDVILIINKIIGNTSDSFHAERADLNNDSTIDISDVIALINIIVTQ